MPRLGGSLVLYFPGTAPVQEILGQLPGDNQARWVREEGGETVLEVTCRKVPLFEAWEMDDVLTALFSSCDTDQILALCRKFGGSVSICLVFHHQETYPAPVFAGENMAMIHKLKADLSVDAY